MFYEWETKEKDENGKPVVKRLNAPVGKDGKVLPQHEADEEAIDAAKADGAKSIKTTDGRTIDTCKTKEERHAHGHGKGH